MLISHPGSKEYSEKSLEEHLFNVAQRSCESIHKQFLNIETISKRELADISYLIGAFHDIGKGTKYFQDYVRGNSGSSQYTFHSLISAVITFYAVVEKYGERWGYIAFLTVCHHHSNLTTYDDITLSNSSISLSVLQILLDSLCNSTELIEIYRNHGINLAFMKEISLNDFQDFLENVDDIIDDIYEQDEDDSIETFLLCNYLFSLLVENDKSDAARLNVDIFKGNLLESEDDVISYIEACREKEPEKYSLNNKMNKIRSEFINDINDNQEISSDKYFYSLTAPTGIGKTFASIHFANILKKNIREKLKYSPRIIYCLPFTSIIEQNCEVLGDILKYTKKDKFETNPWRYIIKHHYLTPKIINKPKNESQKSLKDYQDDALLIESWQSTYVVSTFVQLFHTLVGYENRKLKKLHNIINSIIILDEVQNIPADYHLLTKKIFHVLGTRFNTYFLLSSATQPNLIDNPLAIVDDEKYMLNKIFDRVDVLYEEYIDSFEKICDYFIEYFHDRNALIVLNTKRQANEFYDKIVEKFSEYNLYCLTTYLTPRDRELIIKKINIHLKNNDKIIVVATQLIEAGVDVSFASVYRDIAPLDSIVQVAGRCNRHGEYHGKGKFTIFNSNNTRIYDQYLIQETRKILATESAFSSINFYEKSKLYFDKVNATAKSKKIIKAVKTLKYDSDSNGFNGIDAFAIIDNDYPQKNVLILNTQNAQNLIDELILCKNKLLNLDDNLDKIKEELLIKIQSIKYKLIKFQITIAKWDYDKLVALTNDNGEDIIHNVGSRYNFLEYVKYDDCNFLYVPEKGLNVNAESESIAIL